MGRWLSSSFKSLLDRRSWLYLVPILIGALFAVRSLALISATGLGDPELRTVMKSFVPSMSHLWEILARDVHPPAYYIAVMIAGKTWGQTATVIRLLSWFFYVGCALLTGFAAWLSNRRLGVGVVATLLSFALPFLTRYSIEGKAYAQVSVLMAIALVCRLKSLRVGEVRDFSWLMGYGVSLGLGAASHYFALLLVACFAFSDALLGRARTALTAGLALVPSSLFLLLNLRGISKEGKMSFLDPPGLSLLHDFSATLLGRDYGLAWLLIAFGLALVGIAYFKGGRSPWWRHSVDYGLVASCVLLVGTLGISFLKPIVIGRYYVEILPFCLSGFLVIGSDVVLSSRWRKAVLPALMFLLSLLMIVFWSSGYATIDPVLVGANSRKSDDFRTGSLMGQSYGLKLATMCRKFNASDQVLAADNLIARTVPWTCFKTLDPNLMSKDQRQSLEPHLARADELVIAAVGLRTSKHEPKGYEHLAQQLPFLQERGFVCSWRVQARDAAVLVCRRIAAS
jgi:mannosyltransferase